MRLIYLTGKKAFLEHMDAADSQAFRATVFLSRFLFMIRPVLTRTSIKENGDNKEIDKAFASLFGAIPFCEKRFNSVSS